MTVLAPVTKQTWLVSSIMLTMMGQGMVLGFTSCLLPALQAPGSEIQISLETSSWLVASLGIGNIFGFLQSSIFMDFLGRRITYGLDLLPGIIGMLLNMYAKNVPTLIAGRAIAGVTSGATCTLGAVVIGEYCSPQYRGMFLNMKTAMLYFGSLAVHVTGNYFHWRTVALICALPYALALAITCTWPESPSWLAQRKQFKKSEEVFYRLRGTTEESVREIEELIRMQTEAKVNTLKDKVVEFAKKFTKRNFLKPVVIFVFTAILLEASGRHIFPAFATQIIVLLTGNTSFTFVYTVAIDTIFLTSAMFSSYLIKTMKLRKVLFSTGAASCVVLALACSYLYLEAKEFIPKGYSVIPMILFGMYSVLTNLGCAPIPLALIGEIWPLEHRAVGASIAGYLISIFLTITLKIVPYMLITFEIYGAFGVLTICTALSLLILYFLLPETKNRTLQEIEEFYNHGWFKDKLRGKNEVHMQMLKGDSVGDQ